MTQSTALTLWQPPSVRKGDGPDPVLERNGDDEHSADVLSRLLDPAGLGPVPVIPLVPETVLRKHHCFVATDNRFRAAARLLQALWREDRGLPIGVHRNPEGRRRKLGSRIIPAAGQAGANFLSPEIARLVERELVYRELGAVFETERLRQNLLSSQPLCFNLFAPLKRDLDLATAVFDRLLPGFIARVTDIRFEHSPARGHSGFTHDGTAFDVLIRGYTPDHQRAFIAIEVKYTETGFEPLPRFSGRFDELAAISGLFVDPEDPALRANPIQQLFRQACLATAMLARDLYDVGLHVFIAPRDNHLAQGAAAAYASHLKPDPASRAPFVTIALEDLIAAIALSGGEEHARALHRRYTDFWLIDGELEVDEATPAETPDDVTNVEITA